MSKDIFKAKVKYKKLGYLEGKEYRLKIPTISEMAQVEALSPQEVHKGHRSAWLLILCAEKEEPVKGDDKGLTEWVKAFDTTDLNNILGSVIGSPVSGIMLAVDTAVLELFNEIATGFIPFKEDPTAKK